MKSTLTATNQLIRPKLQTQRQTGIRKWHVLPQLTTARATLPKFRTICPTQLKASLKQRAVLSLRRRLSRLFASSSRPTLLQSVRRVRFPAVCRECGRQTSSIPITWSTAIPAWAMKSQVRSDQSSLAPIRRFTLSPVTAATICFIPRC